jgi:DNA polymerase-4
LANSSGEQGSHWQSAILHLDMDAFYVNVHILDHPEDKGIPLIVGGQPDQRGVVASASYEARAKGIRSAMPCSQAVRLCPQVKIVPANWPRINECSAQVMAILEQYGPVEKMSVDEAYVDLIEQERPEEITREVQTAVHTQTHLPCSVGLATSKLVAKVASDHDKPQGCTIVPPGSEASFMAPLPARAIWCIGPKTAEKLAALSIQNCGQLATADLGQLQAALGNLAAELQQRAEGIDPRRVQPYHGPPQSISQEWTFNNDINDPAVLRRQLEKMCQSVSRSLQKRQLVARTIYVKFRWADFTTFTRQKSVTVGIDSDVEIYRLAAVIWEENWPPGQRMRLLGVGVSNLEAAAVRQLGFGF